MIPRTRVIQIGLSALAALAAAAAITWQVGHSIRPSNSRRSPPIKTWKGGDLLACAVTVDGASLHEFAKQYDVVMLCGTGRSDADRRTDRAITISKAFNIEPSDFEVEEAVSGPMRVLIAETAGTTPRTSSDASPAAEMDLWYELVLVPKGVDRLAIRSVSDVERFGGRLLLEEPRWSVISAWLP